MDHSINRSFCNTRLVSELVGSEDSPENSGDSPRSSAVSSEIKIASTSTSRRSRRGSLQKRVVSIPIKEVEGTKMKGDHMTAPPSDSWAWRKYGQKPIKGSPYPRGYYRCSSSKGCPARKQVERSRVDPNMLVVTYSSEHNHPWPASRQNKSSSSAYAAAAPIKATQSASEEDEEDEAEQEEDTEQEKNPTNPPNQSKEEDIKFITHLCDGPLITGINEFGWFPEFDTGIYTMLESSNPTQDRITTDNEITMTFTMQEEDESLFADLGELPECSTVFRHGIYGGSNREATESQQGRIHVPPPNLSSVMS